DLRTRRRHAARRRQGLPPDSSERRGLGRGTRPPARARRLLQPGIGNARPGAKVGRMGDTASLMLLFDAVGLIHSCVSVFICVYILFILIYIITSWIRLPYSPTLNWIQRNLYELCDP